MKHIESRIKHWSKVLANLPAEHPKRALCEAKLAALHEAAGKREA